MTRRNAEDRRRIPSGSDPCWAGKAGRRRHHCLCRQYPVQILDDEKFSLCIAYSTSWRRLHLSKAKETIWQKLFKRFQRKEAVMILKCLPHFHHQVWLDLTMPDYMSEITTLVQTERRLVGDLAGWRQPCCAPWAAWFYRS